MPTEVISDPAQVAAARELHARRTEQAFVDSLQHPDRIPLDDRGLTLLNARRTDAVAALTRYRDEPANDARQRLVAAIVLKKLDVETEPERIAEILSAHGSAMIEMYVRADALFPPDAPLPDPVRDVVGQAVRGGGDYSRYADSVAQKYRMTEVADDMLARLKPGDVLRDIAKLRPNAALFEQFDRWFNDAVAAISAKYKSKRARESAIEEADLNASLCVVGMIDLAEATNDPALRERAVQRVVQIMNDAPEPFDAQGYQTHLGIIAKVQPRELAVRMLSDVARGTRHEMLRTCALGFLHALEAPLARRLAAELNVVLELGQDTPADGPSDDAILAVLVRHGVITADEAARAKTAPDKPLDMGGGLSEAESAGYHVGPIGRVLSKLRRYLFLDANGDDIPNRNDRFLMKFVPPSMGRFHPEAVLETYSEPIQEGGTGDYEVQFIHGDRLYRLQPWDHYTEMDLDAIVAAVNRAIGDAGSTERFVRIAPQAVFAHYVFADPTRLEAAAKELNLAIGKNQYS